MKRNADFTLLPFRWEKISKIQGIDFQVFTLEMFKTKNPMNIFFKLKHNKKQEKQCCFTAFLWGRILQFPEINFSILISVTHILETIRNRFEVKYFQFPIQKILNKEPQIDF